MSQTYFKFRLKLRKWHGSVIPKLRNRRNMMKANEGGIDRVLRIILGLVLIALVFVGPKSQWGWIGVVPLFTGLIGWCPLYKILGLSTCPMKR